MPWTPSFRSGSVIDRRSTAENCQNRGPSRCLGGNCEHVPPCIRGTTPFTSEARCHCGAYTAYTVMAPPWSPSFRRVPSLIAVAPWKTAKTADLRGGTAETLNMFKTSAVPPRVGPAAPPWPPWHRTMSTVAPPSPPCLRSSLQPPCNRGKKVDWRPDGDPVAVLMC